MQSKERLIDSISLDNGLTIQFIDRSRGIAGDRCQVRLAVRVPLEPKEEFFADYPDPSRALGDFNSLCPSPCFEIEKVRNFIDEKIAEASLIEMKDEYLRYGSAYLRSPKFAARWIANKYGELCRERSTREAHEKVLREIEGKQKGEIEGIGADFK